MTRRALIAALVLAAALPAPALAATWSEPDNVTGSRNAVLSRVALARDGTVAVGWGEGQVALRRPGRDWQRHIVASPGTSATDTDVAFDARGNLLVAWTQARRGGSYQIRVVTWTARTGWGGPRALGRSGHFGLADPRIAVDARGDAIVSWRGFRRSGRRVVEALASSFRPDGGRFGPQRHVTDGGPYQSVALDERGNAYGAFSTYAGRVRLSLQRRGGAWGAPRTLPGRPASKPVILVAPDRSAVIAWRGAGVDSEGDGILIGRVNALVRSPGGAFGAPVTLSSGTVPEIAGAAVSPQGEALLVWGSDDLRFALRPPGEPLGGEQAIAGAHAGPAAYLSDGTALIAYPDGNALRAIARPRGGAFGAPETVTPRGLYPQLATSGRRAVVVYYDPVERLARLVERRG